MLKDLCKILNDVNNNNWKESNYKFNKKNLDAELVLNRLDIICKKKETKQSKQNETNVNNNNNNNAKLYITLYQIPDDSEEYDIDEYKYIFKIGFTKQSIKSRTNQNGKKIKLPVISQSFFILEKTQAQKNEIDILEYLRNNNDFKNILENGNETERFYCNLDKFIELESNINKFKHRLLDNEIENWEQFISSSA